MVDPQIPTRDEYGRRWRPVIGAVALLLVVVIGGVVWFLSGDAPGAVDITSAVEQAEGGASEQQASDSAADGDTWTVDTSVGEFSIAESTGTFVGVRVDEELASVGATTAVVRTPEVSGTVVLDGTTLTAADIEADFTALVSDESRREDAVQRALHTDTYPRATFMLTEPVELGALPTADEPVEVTATGELTINNVTDTVDVPLQVAMVDDVAVITGTFDITFADYDVEAPTAPVVVSVEGSGTVELQLFLTQA